MDNVELDTKIFEEILNGKVEVTPHLGIQLWLFAFMSGVGLLKSVGLLKHNLSSLVGIFELVGGAIFINPMLNKPIFDVVGAGLCLFALGMVISVPKKRLSPVCWVHAVLCMVFLSEVDFPIRDVLADVLKDVKLDVEDNILLGASGLAPLLVGIIFGSIIGGGSEKKTKTN